MTEQTNEPKKMPQFLKVLCILSFIGVGLAIISSIMGYFTAKAAGAMAQGFADLGTQMSEGQAGGEINTAMEQVNATLKYAGINAAIGVIASLICLIGVIMMWKLKKTGFYIYVIGEIAPVIAGAVLLGGTFFGGMAIAMSLIVPIAFIIMYGLNLKHMS
ncbi:MAG: hypothetical protein A2275_07625 [Bacteroidetes bacterium RIFOXYA12_FULL_35_11]|nr:MAG: hypothetical protein A2X01_06880 [Bacteroidetes bacterium GWF2_35_48]OFY73858.1 MAG: hypothetical protein A2275_07625 [Bacteroidetes bacterium RIFOXYA12_FULL_35_11]OFY95510.1 MAG: hypothetical protein A2309_09265 [Bacteroidetes bacterium RIFOXYB2_FULL_35_7]HBX53110.1 hypothetical protein [Bacteroidales bacterium]